MSARKKKPTKWVPLPLPTRVEFDTYRDLRGSWHVNQMQSEKPNTWNGCLNYRRFKVTIELIDEPKEVLAERLRSLWAENDNHHNWLCMQAEAKNLGIELDHNESGSVRRFKKPQTQGITNGPTSTTAV